MAFATFCRRFFAHIGPRFLVYHFNPSVFMDNYDYTPFNYDFTPYFFT